MKNSIIICLYAREPREWNDCAVTTHKRDAAPLPRTNLYLRRTNRLTANYRNNNKYYE